MKAMYKTIVLELLQDQYPGLCSQLKKERALLPALDHYGRSLKSFHERWLEQAGIQKPELDRVVAMSQALELAIEDLKETLSSDFPPSGQEADGLSLDEAMTHIRQAMPRG
jgi:hypothetical protein